MLKRTCSMARHPTGFEPDDCADVDKRTCSNQLFIGNDRVRHGKVLQIFCRNVDASKQMREREGRLSLCCQ